MKKVLNKTMVVLSVALVILCIFCCTKIIYYRKQIAEIDCNMNTAQEKLDTIYANWSEYCDTHYKLFFGEWRVDKIISKNESSGADQNDPLIGMTYYYSDGGIRQGEMSSIDDGDLILARNEYHFSILHADDEIPLSDGFTPRELGVAGDYAIYISVYSDKIPESFQGGHFLIKDNDTLYLFANERTYEMSRIRYHGSLDYRY